MSFCHRKMHAQYNYHPERTRQGGTGEVRRPDPKRPREFDRPGQPDRGRPSATRPKRD